MSDDDTSPDRGSPPAQPPESPGSSVSTRMQEEYTELLKFAIASGFQDSQEVAEGETKGLEEALQSVISQGSTPRQTLQEKEDAAEVTAPVTSEAGENNLNSNNIYHDTCNESAADVVETDISSSNRAAQGRCCTQISLGPDITDMGDKLDTWLGKLKGDILAELSRAVVKSMESQQKAHQQEIKDLVADKQRLERESTCLAERVNACEQSMARKDTLVENLTQALQTSKDKVNMAKIFYTSRAETADERRLAFTEKLAERHHERQLVQKVMRSWFGLIQTKWRCRVQKGCEEQARGVCAQLSQDYEDKIKCLNASIASLEQKVCFLQHERGQYAEQVRKAFMRGVCALNMETMSAFGPDEDLDPATGHSLPKTVSTGPACYQEYSSDDQNYSQNANNQVSPHPATIQELTLSDRIGAIQQQDKQQQQQQQQQHHVEPRSLPVADVPITILDSGSVGSQPRSLPNFTHKTKGKTARTKGRPGSAASSTPTRHTVRSGGVTNQSQPLAPPMASIVVERHNPVTKQTLGKATASRYPKTSMGQVSKSQPSSLIGQSFKPLAGQTMLSSSVKVVD